MNSELRKRALAAPVSAIRDGWVLQNGDLYPEVEVAPLQNGDLYPEVEVAPRVYVHLTVPRPKNAKGIGI